jgi:hypothetical protein
MAASILRAPRLERRSFVPARQQPQRDLDRSL